MDFLEDNTLPTELTLSMIEASQIGAKEALRNRAIGLRAHQKSAAEGDIVTQGDQAAQAAIFSLLPASAIIDGIQQVIGFHAEEGMHEGYEFPVQAQWRWCVDPIDGTKPYFKGEHYWSVSVALQKLNTAGDNWDSHAGVVYRSTAADTLDVLHGKAYWAEKGRGAYALEVKPGRQARLGKPDIIAPVVECETSPEVTTPEAITYAKHAQEIFSALGLETHFRRSICHSVCELLEGERAAVVQGVGGPFDWDIAAISVIAAEAGVHAKFTPRILFEGKWRYPAIMAWDKKLFEQLVAIAP
jgi:3'(2'), 5'-bisphosphate nucleotidase/myo-inositol-1(or 4)-monophosphatase